jgi:cell wall-associated NlpC family hydrolase
MLQNLLIFIILFLPSFSTRSQNPVSVTTPAAQEKVAPGVDRTNLVDYARQFLGTPYRRGSADPAKGFDCSGFVNYVFRHYEVSVPRSSREFTALGASLKPDEFRVGDIVIFYGFRDRGHVGHVGIICEANGMKSKFIHASSGKAHRVTISDLASSGYTKRFYKCIDVIQ